MAINVLDGLSDSELELFDEISWDSCFGIKEEVRTIIYDFNVGDTVRVTFEDNNTLEGVCTFFLKEGVDSSFRIKKTIKNYIGKPKLIKLYLDSIQSIEVLKKSSCKRYDLLNDIKNKSHYKNKWNRENRTIVLRKKRK